MHKRPIVTRLAALALAVLLGMHVPPVPGMLIAHGRYTATVLGQAGEILAVAALEQRLGQRRLVAHEVLASDGAADTLQVGGDLRRLLAVDALVRAGVVADLEAVPVEFGDLLPREVVALVGAEGEPVQATLVANLRAWLFNGGIGISSLPVSLANAFRVFFELAGGDANVCPEN